MRSSVEGEECIEILGLKIGVSGEQCLNKIPSFANLGELCWINGIPAMVRGAEVIAVGSTGQDRPMGKTVTGGRRTEIGSHACSHGVKKGWQTAGVA